MDEEDSLGFFRKIIHHKRKNSKVDSFLKHEGEDEFDGPSYDVIQKPKVSRPAESREYRLDHPSTGIALIFNHKHIDGQPPRRGTTKDKTRLSKCLEALGFEVIVYDDQTFEQITEILENFSKIDHSNNNCFCITVLSHGVPGKLYASDTLYPVERLWEPFLGNSCQSLINKPKIFFIQACRGEEFDTGAQYDGSVRVMTSFFNDSTDTSGTRTVTYTIPKTADLLVMYSTYEGNYSWRNPEHGSYFIQSLCEEIEEFIESTLNEIDLFHLLVGVCRTVAYEFQSNVPQDETRDKMKEMPQIVSTLTKIFYFRKQYWQNNNS